MRDTVGAGIGKSSQRKFKVHLARPRQAPPPAVQLEEARADRPDLSYLCASDRNSETQRENGENSA